MSQRHGSYDDIKDWRPSKCGHGVEWRRSTRLNIRTFEELLKIVFKHLYSASSWVNSSEVLPVCQCALMIIIIIIIIISIIIMMIMIIIIIIIISIIVIIIVITFSCIQSVKFT